MNGFVPCENIGKFGGLNFCCSMGLLHFGDPASQGRLPKGYCEILTDGNANVLPLNCAGSTRAPRTSMVWRTLRPVSEMAWAKICAGVSVAPPLPVSATRASSKSETPLQDLFAGHCKTPLVWSSRLSYQVSISLP